MGVVFALGLLFVVAVVVGFLLALTGVIILIVRAVKKKKNLKKYTGTMVTGIVLTSLGGLLLAAPAALTVYGIAGFAEAMTEQAYFDEYEDTSYIIDVPEGSVRNKRYINDTFEYNGRLYRKTSVRVLYRDEYRGGAAANLSDGTQKVTVYEFNYPKDCKLLCAGSIVYCADDDLDRLTEYFNGECSFEYRYVRHSRNIDRPLDMTDEMFSGLINYSADYVRAVDSNGINSVLQFYIDQHGDGERLDRELEVNIDGSGSVYVRSVRNPFPLPRDIGDFRNMILVTDENAVKLLKDIADILNEN